MLAVFTPSACASIGLGSSLPIALYLRAASAIINIFYSAYNYVRFLF